MIIRFKKGGRKPGILTCVRSDGSSTWTRLHPALVIHDLAHLVVEIKLGFAQAFYGTVAKGYDIGDFALPRDERPIELIPANLPVEAHQAEHLVNLLQVSLVSGTGEVNVLSELRSILRDKGIDYPADLDQPCLDQIVIRLKGLIDRWNVLNEGEVMEFVFGSRD